MIINTGQRSDIPAFYPKWFINRIKEGYVDVRNPYYPRMVTRFSLSKDVVDVIGFCSKNPAPLFTYLDELGAYHQFWYITITGLGKEFEPNVPSKDKVIEDFKYLSSRLGSNCVGWRYTPIIITSEKDASWHIANFEYIASRLAGFTNLAVFGFLDLYKGLERSGLKDCSELERIEIAKEFSKIASNYNMELRLCSKEKYLSRYGIDVNGCMRLEDYERACKEKLVPKKKMEARKGYCSCFLSNDIGAYSSCPHFCSYCYANRNKQTVLNNFRNHDDNSSFLIGGAKEDDLFRLAKQESWIYKGVSLL